MNLIIAFAGGAVFGALIVILLVQFRKKDAENLARELVNQAETQKLHDLEALLGRVRESFNSLSLEALSKSNAELVRMAEEKLGRHASRGEQELESKKKLIDQNVDLMRGDITKMQVLVSELERDRQQKFGELTAQLKASSEQTSKLQDTTEHLRQALSSTKVRGQWGERMAEDVLRLAGFIEGLNYLKQKALETAGSRPDYTFLLPQERTLNMDVKFPLDNYVRFLEAEGDEAREKAKAQFLRDVKTRIKEVTTRDYINPEENTLDYVLVFIPNEQVYAFINENDRDILDNALKHKVILCSPITLYAILAVIRQAMDNFSLEKTAGQMLSLMGAFQKQYEAFVRSLKKMGDRLEDARNEFQSLTTTRRNQLEKPLRKIEALRVERGIEPAEELLLETEAIIVEPGPD
jgi:DNA recombination protein RmuC